MEQLKRYIRFNEISGFVKLEPNGLVAVIDKPWWYYLCECEGVSTYKILKDIHDYTGAKYSVLDRGGYYEEWLYPWDEIRQCYYGNVSRKEVGI